MPESVEMLANVHAPTTRPQITGHTVDKHGKLTIDFACRAKFSHLHWFMDPADKDVGVTFPTGRPFGQLSGGGRGCRAGQRRPDYLLPPVHSPGPCVALEVFRARGAIPSTGLPRARSDQGASPLPGLLCLFFVLFAAFLRVTLTSLPLLCSQSIEARFHFTDDIKDTFVNMELKYYSPSF